MIGGFPFALARAKAAAAPLITLAIVSAIAAALVAGLASAIQVAEAREVRSALASSPGDLGRVVLSGGSDAAAVAEAAEAHLAEAGVGRAVVVEVVDGRVVVSPALDRIAGSDVAPLADAVANLASAVDAATGGSVQAAGALDGTLGAIDDAIEARRGPTAVAVALLGLLTAVVVGAVALESVRARDVENRLLRARGARRRDLAWGGALEAFTVGVAGALVGAAVGVALGAVVGGIPPPLLLGAAAAVAIGIVCAVTVAVATTRSVDRGSVRARAVVDIGFAVIFAVLTGVAAWQFIQAGSPVVLRGDGTSALDPLVAVAPALVLTLAALVAVALATPIARLVAASLSRTRGVQPVTPLRLASRRPARHALSIVVVAFAIGAVTVAGAYQGTLLALGDAPEELRVGADVRVGTIPEDVDTGEIAALQPSDASMLARPVSARASDRRIPILAVQSNRLGEVMPDAGGTIDPTAIGEVLVLGDAGQPLDGDITLRILAQTPPPVEVDGVQLEPQPVAAFIRATAVSEDGRLVNFVTPNFEEAETDSDNGSFIDVVVDPDFDVTFELPEGVWRLVGLDAAAFPFGFEAAPVVLSATSAGTPVDLTGFGPAPGSPGAVEVVDDGLSIAPTFDAQSNPWTRAVADGVPASIPVVMTAPIAESMSLDEGERFSLQLESDFDADFVVAGIVPVLPGTATGDGMLVDLATLSLASPDGIVPNQVWMSSTDPAALATAVEEQFPQTVTVVADSRAAANAAGTVVGFALAALGAVLLALVVLVLRRTRSRADSRELAILAVMGLGRPRAARVRASEDLFAVVMGALGGLAAGAVTAWLVVPSLARAAYGSIPAAFPVPLEVDPLLLTIVVVVAVAAFALIVSSVRAPAALAPLLREDE